jgi:hypothetical protein
MGMNFKLSRETIATLLLPFVLTAFGADGPRPVAAPQPAPPKTSGVKFRPPPTGISAVRVTGGSRGAGDKTVTLDVLAPNDIGMTTQEQPSLYWFQSKPANAKFELTVVQENKVKPVVHMTVDRAANAGIQRVKLSEFNAKLEPGVEYQWVVALISDPENRSTDLIASGVIKRIAPTTDLTDKLAKRLCIGEASHLCRRRNLV